MFAGGASPIKTYEFSREKIFLIVFILVNTPINDMFFGKWDVLPAEHR